MHPEEHVATVRQVTLLVAEQLPQWADLPVTAVSEFGTDHCLFHLGADLVVRMPRAPWAVEQVERDARWLPHLAPHLPVPIPTPVALGEPGQGFPWPWSVVPWIEGVPPVADDDSVLGLDLAGFVTALHAVPSNGGPPKQAGTRGAPVRDWDDAVRQGIEQGRDLIATVVDPDLVIETWQRVRATPDWSGDPVWIHGDLLPGNMLVRDGRLSAVIDFGGLGLGDPAADLIPFWTGLNSTEREVFRDAVGYDEDTWTRALGWAIAPAITGLDYYRDSVQAFVDRGLRTLAVALPE